MHPKPPDLFSETPGQRRRDIAFAIELAGGEMRASYEARAPKNGRRRSTVSGWSPAVLKRGRLLSEVFLIFELQQRLRRYF
jgi:hypothetical protein